MLCGKGTPRRRDRGLRTIVHLRRQGKGAGTGLLQSLHDRSSHAAGRRGIPGVQQAAVGGGWLDGFLEEVSRCTLVYDENKYIYALESCPDCTPYGVGRRVVSSITPTLTLAVRFAMHDTHACNAIETKKVAKLWPRLFWAIVRWSSSIRMTPVAVERCGRHEC